MSAAVVGESSRRRAESTPSGDAARLKVEPDVDIKDYAETTMNELLGWYGYDKLDTRGLNLRNLNHGFPTSSSSSSPLRHEDDMSEEDAGCSRSSQGEGESITPITGGGTITCAWCLKTGMKLFTLKTPSGEVKAFCSEPCFNQCRRAAFKKNRICNWCRHVRHTVNYVDFQDGDDQLQFCSDKCLNQYKMQIFCKETQAYLQMNPHLQEEAAKNPGGSSKLITPDLWLRDCQDTVNGAESHDISDDEMSPSGKSKNCDELEDLSVTSKKERPVNTLGNVPSPMDRDSSMRTDPLPPREKRSIDVCSTLASYLREDKDKIMMDRKKKFHENERERKRQRMALLRNKVNQLAEAPPAHHSSVHSPVSFQNQNRQFHSTSPYPAPLTASSPAPLNPPAAHSSSIPSHPALASSILPPNLPPPPPLLNNDFLHPSFNSSLFAPPMNAFPHHQQQMDAILRKQSGMRPGGPPLSSHLFYESMLPLLRGSAQQPISSPAFPQPNMLMFPCPMFVPLPVPIPIPIPLPGLLPRDKKLENGESQKSKEPLSSTDNNDVPGSTSDKINYSKNTVDEPQKSRQSKTPDSSSSYAITNNDNQTHRLVLKRNRSSK